jgi:hypothetical protein
MNLILATQAEWDDVPAHHRFIGTGLLQGRLLIDSTEPIDCLICQKLAVDSDPTGMSADEKAWLG